MLKLRARGVVGQFLSAVTDGTAREIACFGARGDGKTVGALMAMVAHARKHQAAGYKLPVPWIGVTDTFQSHKLKTIRSIRDPLWQGLWQIKEQGHVAEFVLDGTTLVHLDLFGIEDQGARDRVRMETCGVWFEEPAPTALLVQSAGIDRESWGLAVTSQRVPTHAKVAMMTLNYPDEDHWTWQRFIANPQPGTMYFRVPPGERASAEDRAEWMEATKDRPDMQRRLLLGLPGAVLLGEQVAVGFREDLHVATEKLKPIAGEPLIFGQDAGHTPTVIIGQAWRGYLRIYAALTIDRGGMRQLYEQWVLPWMVANAKWAIRSESIRGVYDPATPDDQSDTDKNPIDVCRELVGGYWEPGPVPWESRKNALITALNRHGEPGKTALQIDPEGGKDLVRALSGRWYYPKNRLGGVSKDAPAKPNHPWEDFGDALCYFICGAIPELTRERPRDQGRTFSRFDARFVGDDRVEQDWDSRT